MLKVEVKVKGHVIRALFVPITKIASSRRQIAGLRPNLHKMVSRSALIQDVLKVKVKVKGHVLGAVLCWHEKRFSSEGNDRIATKLAHDGLQVSMHPRRVQFQGQGQRSPDTGTFVLDLKSLFSRRQMARLRPNLHTMVYR